MSLFILSSAPETPQTVERGAAAGSCLHLVLPALSRALSGLCLSTLPTSEARALNRSSLQSNGSPPGLAGDGCPFTHAQSWG
jgi:hypothetical protein